MRTLSIIKMVMLCVMFGSAGINADIKKAKDQQAKIEKLLKIDADTIENSDERQKMQDIQKFLTRYVSALKSADTAEKMETFISLADEIQDWPKNKRVNRVNLKNRGIDTSFLVGEIYHQLGVAYFGGWEGEPDFLKALHFYQKAIREEHYIASINNLAKIYYEGQGIIEPNLQKASRLFLLAAQQDDAVAQFNFGQILFFKKSIYEEAYYWYNRAKINEKDLKRARNTPDPLYILNTDISQIKNHLNDEKIKELQDLTSKDWKPKKLDDSGSGFYITKEYILTNAHVVCSNDISSGDPCVRSYEVRTPYYRLDIEKTDPKVDLALLKVVSSRKDSSSAKIRSGLDLQLGEGIAVFGYPLAEKLSFEGNFTIGNVSAREGRPTEVTPSDFFQFTAPVQRGNSGGPVLDAAGNVVGVARSLLFDLLDLYDQEQYDKIEKLNIAQNINFAVSLKAIKNFLKAARIEPDSSSKKLF